MNANESRFQTLDEFYRAVEILIVRLQGEGHAHEAQELQALMHTAWTTSSELLGELRLAFRN